MFTKTDCKKCKGWYNSCSPDDYADYIRDPDHCEYFEPIEAPTSDNSDYAKCAEMLKEIADYPGRRPEDCDDIKKLAKEALHIIACRQIKEKNK